ncbi:MAG TPA: cytochrome c biogenesis protein [Bacteroidota bacterium]|jgi:heme exporter protein C|nr:cytochrome c biogenesis protein [Bacteroidota bacterium]
MLKIVLGIWLTIVIVVAFAFPIVPQPQQWFEYPVIPGLEEKARILFFHVPMSWTTVVAFFVSMIYGIRYLKTKNLRDDMRSVSSAGLGLMFCVLATVTGSVWAKFNWGSFWNWDPRETSIFILLLIYGAYFALRSALEDEAKRATLAAVYAIIAGVTVPFFIFVMPRIMASLHPEPIVNTEGKVHMNATMLIVFLSSLAGFTALFAWMLQLRIRLARLEQHYYQKEN